MKSMRRKRKTYKERMSERDAGPPRCAAVTADGLFLDGPLPASGLIQ